MIATTLDLSGHSSQAKALLETFVSTGNPGHLGSFPWSVQPSAEQVAPQAGRVAVLDTFAFNGDLVLELRLALLAPYVDRFYVVEATVTHSGTPKSVVHSNTDRWRRIFARYGEKVKVILVDSFPSTPWVRRTLFEQRQSSSCYIFIIGCCTASFSRPSLGRSFSVESAST